MTSGHRPSRTAQHLTRRLRRPGLTLALVAALLATAGCGGSDGDSSTPAADQTAPTVVITDSTTAATATGDVTFSFTFTEDVGQSFAAADVTLTGGTKGAFTRLSSTVYRLVTTPDADTLGTLAVSVAAGAFADLAGNASTAAATASQAYDTRVLLTQMTLPVTFDVATQDYGLVGFGGADASTIELDPGGSATNHVARVVRSAAAETWAGTTITKVDQLGFATAIPFDASNTRVSVRVWSPDSGIVVRLKAEDHTSAAVYVETDATTTTHGQWETLTFDFAAAATLALNPANTYDKLSIFFNFGVAGATAGEKTYFFDDVVFVGGGGLPVAPASFEPVDFDSTAVTYTLTGFGGADASSLVLDPAGGATNHVARVVKSATAETWAGTTFSTHAGNAVGVIPLDANNTRMTVRVRSPDAGIKVRLKVEDHANAGVSVETEATTSVANGWETLTFDFANPASGTAALNVSSTYDKASIFFNFGVAGATAGEKIYFFDDVVFVGGGGLPVAPASFEPVDFESTATSYTLTPFEGVSEATIVLDPAGSSTNHVVRVVKSATAQPWAGTTISTLAGNRIGKIAFDATHTRMTVRVWSPDSGITVRLKAEDATDNTVTVETDATTTVANGWESLTFDFATQASGTAALNVARTYDRLSIFFNFGVSGATAGEKTYYLDEIGFVP